MRLTWLLAIVGGVLALGPTACSSDEQSRVEISVFGAASLTESFTELGARFEKAHPGTQVTFNFGASSALVQQITEGAPADVYASADESNMKKLTDAGLQQGEPAVFAKNKLAILVEPGNPQGIAGLQDLAKPDLSVVLCAAEVPCGKFAEQVLDAAGVNVTPKSYEENVKGVVTKVTLGEADAGIVYVTDARAAAAKSDSVTIPDAENAIASYPIVVTKESSNTDAAAEFVEFVRSAEAKKVLAEFGFITP